LTYYKYNGVPPSAQASSESVHHKNAHLQGSNTLLCFVWWSQAIPDFFLDLKDISRLYKHKEILTFDLYNVKGEQVLRFKSTGEKDMESWVDILERKIDYLKNHHADDSDFEITLVTNTFIMLQLMNDVEIVSVLVDAFPPCHQFLCYKEHEL